MNSKRNYMIVECSDINFSKALIYINKKKNLYIPGYHQIKKKVILIFYITKIV